MMAHTPRSTKLIFFLLPLCLLSSCNYRALSKENEKLENIKAELTESVEKLKAEIAEDPVDHHALLEQAETELQQAEQNHQTLQSTNTQLKGKHAELEKQYAEDKKNYIIK